MVKTPKTRHSKSHREPMTIELEPEAVSRMTDADQPATEAPAAPLADRSEPADGPAQAEGMETAGASQPQAEDASAAPQGYDFSSNEDRGATRSTAAEAAGAPPYSSSRQDNRSGGIGLVAAGIVGGVIALAGAGALQWAGVLPPSGGESALSDSVRTELSQLRQAVAGLENEAGGPDTELTGRVDALTQAVEQLKSDTSGLKQAMENSSGGENAGQQALETRLTEAEASISALRQQGGQQADGGELAAMGEKLAGLEALVTAANEAARNSEAKLGTLEQAVGTLGGKVEAQAGQPKIALSIAASALKTALDRGAPFEAELETFAAIAPDAPQLQSLRAYAGKGVSSREELVAESDAAVKAMIAAERPVAENAGFLDRLLSSAESLVSVRPIGVMEGTGVPETAARMEFALKSGNLQQALAEYDSLPEPAKAAGSAFADKVRARAQAEQLVDQLVAGAMKA